MNKSGTVTIKTNKDLKTIVYLTTITVTKDI